jgi:hypothetical protein
MAVTRRERDSRAQNSFPRSDEGKRLSGGMVAGCRIALVRIRGFAGKRADRRCFHSSAAIRGTSPTARGAAGPQASRAKRFERSGNAVFYRTGDRRLDKACGHSAARAG